MVTEADVIATDGRVAGLRVERMKLADLHPHPRNPRVHPEPGTAEWNTLKASLEHDYFDPIVWNVRNGQLVSGHLRTKVLTELGFTEADCVVVDYDEPTHIARMIAANRQAGEFEGAQLKDLLIELDTGGFEMDLTGIDLKALEEIVVPVIPLGADQVGAELSSRADELLEKWRCERGQVWAFGEHRLMCGDSTEPNEVATLMGEQRAGLMNTDPPYGINYGDIANSRDRASGNRDDKKIANDDLEGAELQAFLEKAIRTALPHLIEKPAFYLWHPMLTQGTFFAAAAAADILIHRQIIWVKPSLIMGRGDYHWRHELCFYGWIRGKRCEWLAGRDQDTVWEIGRDHGGDHPTQKPVELFVRPITNHTRPGDVVYEPFAGSGSQFVAAQQLKRRCFGMEIEPKWCAVILERMAESGLAPALDSAPAASAQSLNGS